jgi:hypothetical protein
MIPTDVVFQFFNCYAIYFHSEEEEAKTRGGNLGNVYNLKKSKKIIIFIFIGTHIVSLMIVSPFLTIVWYRLDA